MLTREIMNSSNGLLLQSSQLKFNKPSSRRYILEQTNKDYMAHELMEEAIKLGANNIQHEFIFFSHENTYKSDEKRNILGDYTVCFVFLLAAVKTPTMESIYSLNLPQYIYMAYVPKENGRFETIRKRGMIKYDYEDMCIHFDSIPKNQFWKKVIHQVQ